MRPLETETTRPEAQPTRKEFLLTLAGAPLLAGTEQAEAGGRKALIVAAHPDDEYAVAAIAYRLSREAGWTLDHVVITNGEGGYRYAALAETIYGVPLTAEKDGRRNLPAIRKQETLNAGKVLGVRNHYFLDQTDSGFANDAALAGTGNWDRARILGFLTGLLRRERYDAVLLLLPTRDTHGHHRETALLALEAVSQFPEDARPAVLGAEPGAEDAHGEDFPRVVSGPLTRVVDAPPLLAFDRRTSFGYRGALNYHIVVNWVIAEHKSQGLFQSDRGRHEVERFWLFAVSGSRGAARARTLANDVTGAVQHASAR